MRYLVEMEQIEAAAALMHSLEKQSPRPPEDAEWNYLAAFILQQSQSRLADALSRYNLALKYGFDEFWVRYNRGALHAQMGNPDQAMVDLMRAVELKPDHEGVKQMLKQIVTEEK